MEEIAEALRGLMDVPCWRPRRSHGSMFLVEFGPPHLEIDEPRPMPNRIPGLPATLLRRPVSVKGSWTLMVENCDWWLRQGEVLIADSDSSHEEIDAALRVLEGQALTAFDVDRSSGAASFAFDLGAQLSARPAAAGADGDEPADQWTLFRPDGLCMVVRDDLQYTIQPAEFAEGPVVWSPLRCD